MLVSTCQWVLTVFSQTHSEVCFPDDVFDSLSPIEFTVKMNPYGALIQFDRQGDVNLSESEKGDKCQEQEEAAASS